jgi:2-iminoacetate synthase ThiH
MNDLAATAQRLRDVKEATRHFMALWSLEQTRQRVRRGEEIAAGTVEDILDTAAVEAAILELDVYASASLISGVLADQ